MDSIVTAAARSLASGDPLSALNLIALREDAPALALRGVAMAQLGELARAKLLLRRAIRAFGEKEIVARSRCIVAEAEVAFASRDLNWPPRLLESARATLEAQGDEANATHARYLAIRRDLLIGRVADAERSLERMQPARFAPAMRAVHELVVAGIAMRRLQIARAREAVERAATAARIASIPALDAEIDAAAKMLSAPAARLLAGGRERLLRLHEVEALQKSDVLIVDACRLAVRHGEKLISLAKRPVLFTLLRALAQASPAGVSRQTLVTVAFRGRRADESHRARLRVEIGRLRKMLGPLCTVAATAEGYALVADGAPGVVVLAQPFEGAHAAILAFMADGESWSSSALGLALGQSQRSVQRSLETLMRAGRIQSYGHGRARRWTTPPVPGFTTTLLLPSPLPID